MKILVDDGGFSGADDDVGGLAFLVDDSGGGGGVGDAGNSVLEAPQDHTPPIVTVTEIVEVWVDVSVVVEVSVLKALVLFSTHSIDRNAGGIFEQTT